MPYKEGNKWRAKITVQGQRHTKLKDTKKEAVRWEVEKKKELKSSPMQESLDLLTLTVKYLRYAKRFSDKTWQEKNSLCKRILAKWSNDIPVQSITAEMVQVYLDTQHNARSANASNKDRKNLLSIWSWGNKFLRLHDNPISFTEKLSWDLEPQYTPPTEDVLKLLAVVTRKERVFLYSYIYTGARRSEIFRWIWVEDINFERREYRLGTRKTKDGSMQYEWFPMPEELYQELEWWWRNRTIRNSPYVFVDDNPGPHYGKPHTARRKFMRGLCKRADVQNFGFHALRRFFASRLADMGKSTNTIRRMLRHKRVSTTERYIQNINDDLAGVTNGILEGKIEKKAHEKARKK